MDKIKVKEINISFMFVIGCIFLLIFCLGFGITYNKLLLSLVLFLVSIVVFILFELLGTFIVDEIKTKNKRGFSR